MAITLVKEDGTGLANANAYASAADGVAWNDTFAVTGGQFYRDCSGTAGYFRVAQSAANGLVLPPYSNVVQSDGL